MRRVTRAILLLTLCLLAVGLTAEPAGILTSEKVKGLSRFCAYSDGGIMTVAHTDLCPRRNPLPTKNGSPPSVNIERKGGPVIGPLSAQKIQGANRYCSYADGTLLTVAKNTKCPNKSR